MNAIKKHPTASIQHPKASLCCGILVVALAGAFSAAAQSDRVPGDTEYSQFSQFISERNIFNPERYPRNSHHYVPPVHTTRIIRHTEGAPEFTFVGTMSYQKGLFVFFDGNSSELRKVLEAGGSIAGYTVEEVTSTAVKLLGADKTEVVLKLGDQMQQDDGKWQMTGQAALPGAGSTATETAVTGESSTAPAATPSASLQANEVLKRLMEKRAQEQ